MRDFDAELRHARQDRRRRRGGCDHHVHLMRPGLRPLVLQHRAHDDGRTAHVRHLVLDDGLENGLGNHLAQTHVDPRHGHVRVVEAPAVAVEHGQRPQVHRVLVDVPLRDVAHGVQGHAAVVQQHTLGVRCGPTRVAEGQRVPLVPWRAPLGVRVALREQLLVGQRADEGAVLLTQGVIHVHDQRSLVRRNLLECLRHGLAELAIHQHHLCLGVRQHEGDVADVQAVVQRVDHGPQHRDPEVGLDVLGCVAEHAGDNVAVVDAALPQRRA
mmetsp:Transcript_84529/g.217749  ORF Transcript_84529/g.217749 Transcript_84529/m.217749 type:complete len:270 (-) Transcript_84529:236-1045(-)